MKKVLSMINGLQIRYKSYDPLEDDDAVPAIEGLPYSHKNLALIPHAAKIWSANRRTVLTDTLNWVITITPVSITGENMREPMQHSATCEVDDLTESVLSHIQVVMDEINDAGCMDFYSYWLFNCEIKK